MTKARTGFRHSFLSQRVRNKNKLFDPLNGSFASTHDYNPSVGVTRQQNRLVVGFE